MFCGWYSLFIVCIITKYQNRSCFVIYTNKAAYSKPYFHYVTSSKAAVLYKKSSLSQKLKTLPQQNTEALRENRKVGGDGKR